MPEFSPGVAKTAIVTMSNPKAKPFDYLAELYMGTDLALMVSEDFHLEAEESKDISLLVTMPNTPGTYPVHIGVFSGGESIGLYKATEDVVVKAPVISIAVSRAYLRDASPSVSEAYSGWVSMTPGGEINLGLFGLYIQAGALLVNNSSVPVVLGFEAWNHHWTTEGYVDLPLAVPLFEPQRFPPAPTGLAYSSYKYEADKFCPPGTTLAPGETGFVYTALYRQGRRWNYINLRIYANGQDVGTVRLYSGWYSY